MQVEKLNTFVTLFECNCCNLKHVRILHTNNIIRKVFLKIGTIIAKKKKDICFFNLGKYDKAITNENIQ